MSFKKRKADGRKTKKADRLRKKNNEHQELLSLRREIVPMRELARATLAKDTAGIENALAKCRPWLRGVESPKAAGGIPFTIEFKLAMIQAVAASPRGGQAAVLRRYGVSWNTFDRWRTDWARGVLGKKKHDRLSDEEKAAMAALDKAVKRLGFERRTGKKDRPLGKEPTPLPPSPSKTIDVPPASKESPLIFDWLAEPGDIGGHNDS